MKLLFIFFFFMNIKNFIEANKPKKQETKAGPLYTD